MSLISELKAAFVSRQPTTMRHKTDDVQDKINKRIQLLKKALENKTDEVFTSRMSQITRIVGKTERECIKNLVEMNGTYYQDPCSTLKQDWDTLVAGCNAIGVKIENADQLNETLALLNTNPTDEATRLIKKIEEYKVAVQERDEYQVRLNQIRSIEKAALNSEEELKTRKAMLEQKHQELCGKYFGDPSGLLDQAWQKYQTAIAHDSTSAETAKCSLHDYQELDKCRRQIEAQLYDIEQQLATPTSTRTCEVLTTDSINQEILKLQILVKQKSNLSNKIDLDKIAADVVTKKAIFAKV